MEEKLIVFTAFQNAIDYLKLELNPNEGANLGLDVFINNDSGRKSILSAKFSANEEWEQEEEPSVNIVFKIDYQYSPEGYEYARKLQNFLFLYFAERLKNSYINAVLNEEGEGEEKTYLLKISAESTPLSSMGIILTKAIKSIYPDIPDSAVNMDILDNEYTFIERF